MTVNDDDKQSLDTANNPGNSSLPSTLLPHLYTRDSGTRTTLLSSNNCNGDGENHNEDQVKLKSDIGSGSDQPGRRSMTAPVSPSTSSTSPFPSQQQQPRSHFSSGDPIATASSGGPIVSSSSGRETPPIRSDPAYYTQPSRSSLNYGQSGSYSSYPMAASSRRPRLARVVNGMEATAGMGYHQSASYSPTSISVSGMSSSPISPDSPYSQTYSDSTMSRSSGSYKTHHFSNVALPHGREWSHSPMSSMIPENRSDLLDIPFETRQHDVVHDRTRKRSFEDGERPLSSSSVTTTAVGTGEKLNEPESNSKKKQKADIACDFCRGRKLRCDTKKPQCSNCASREKQVCHYKEFQRRRGPGKANKGLKVVAKPRKTSSVTTGRSDDHPGEVGQKRGMQPQYPSIEERETVGYVYYQPPNSRTESDLRGQNEALYTDRVQPQIRQPSYFGNSQLPPLLHPEHQPRYHQESPPFPYPAGPPSNRWHSQSNVAVKHEPQMIWEPPLPIHPYLTMKSEVIEDARHRFEARYDPYGHRGSSYSMFDEQYDSDDLRHVSETQVYRNLYHDSQGGFASSTSPASLRHAHRSEIPRTSSEGYLPIPNRIEHHRSGSPAASEGRPAVSVNERLGLDV